MGGLLSGQAVGDRAARGRLAVYPIVEAIPCPPADHGFVAIVEFDVRSGRDLGGLAVGEPLAQVTGAAEDPVGPRPDHRHTSGHTNAPTQAVTTTHRPIQTRMNTPSHQGGGFMAVGGLRAGRETL